MGHLFSPNIESQEETGEKGDSKGFGRRYSPTYRSSVG